MGKVLSKDNILKPIKVCLSHQGSHVFMDEVDVIFSFDDSVHIDVHDNIETVVYILSYERKHQFK